MSCAICLSMTEQTKSPENAPHNPEKAGDNPPAQPREIGGRNGLDPVRYGDWEKDGRCVDF